MQRTGQIFLLFLITAGLFCATTLGNTLFSSPRISTLSSGLNLSGAAAPGEVIFAEGSDFSSSAVIHLAIAGADLELATKVVSSTQLNFVVPLGLPCGLHEIYVVNQSGKLGDLELTSRLHPFELGCLSGNRTIDAVLPWITGIEPRSLQPGEPVRVAGRNFSFGDFADEMPLALIDSELEVASWWISPTELAIPTLPQDLGCGPHKLQIFNRVADYRHAADTGELGDFAPYVAEVPGNFYLFNIVCHAGIGPATGGGGVLADITNLSILDTDNNCLLGDREFMQAIDFWISGQLVSDLFLKAVDHWIAESPFCSAASSGYSKGPLSIHVAQRFGKTIIHVESESATALGVDLFSTSGERILSQSTVGKSLRVSFHDQLGRSLSNGIYILRVTTATVQGLIETREWRRLYITR